MTTRQDAFPKRSTGVSLVDGDSEVRHARQLMLRSEDYEVRSYPTASALLADPRSREYLCIILDIDMGGIDGSGLLSAMRASGWCGNAIILDSSVAGSPLGREAGGNGDRVFNRNISDRALIAAITDLPMRR